MDAKPLLLRADADARQGTGHVMRCLALAQGWQDAGGRAVLLGRGGGPGLEARLAEEGIAVEAVHAEPGTAEDARRTAAAAGRLGAEWVVVDGYQFTAAYQCALKDAGLRVLALDDYGHAGHHHADLVLNQNLDPPEASYRARAPYTRLLLGPRFALLRREFRRWRAWQRPIPDVARKVLVTLGGADPPNATLRVLGALGQLRAEGLEAVVLVGAANPHRAALTAAARDLPGVRLQVNAADMPGLMAWADGAVAAAGSTSWELLFMGLPSCVLVLADNQEAVGPALARAGAALCLGPAAALESGPLADILGGLLHDARRRRELSDRGRAIVDGQGAARVVERMWTSSREGA
jgi:UDP-2,4-diacetamido-2,4,6-trideoxy-beta-L-altropyranose hydrolase